MAEYIDKELLLDTINQSPCENGNQRVAQLLYYILNAPATDVSPVKHGKWLYKGYVCGDTAYQCSACDEIEWRTSCDRLKYCPFCGAKMDGGDNV